MRPHLRDKVFNVGSACATAAPDVNKSDAELAWRDEIQYNAPRKQCPQCDSLQHVHWELEVNKWFHNGNASHGVLQSNTDITGRIVSRDAAGTNGALLERAVSHPANMDRQKRGPNIRTALIASS
jgi:hypothetical protein